MPGFAPRSVRPMLAALLLGLAGGGLLGGCANYEPREYTADDRCRDCSGTGGILTGEDGVFSLEL